MIPILLLFHSLLAYQSDNGMWCQLVDYPYAWAESSGTAMFVYAMAVGINQGWLPEGIYKPAVEKALAALSAHIDREGNLREIALLHHPRRPRRGGRTHRTVDLANCRAVQGGKRPDPPHRSRAATLPLRDELRLKQL